AGATTLKALDDAGDGVGRTLDALPATEAVATNTLADARPVLGDAVAIARGLRSGTPLLPTATHRLNRALDAATPLLADVHRTQAAARLGAALDALGAVVRNPARSPA